MTAILAEQPDTVTRPGHAAPAVTLTPGKQTAGPHTPPRTQTSGTPRPGGDLVVTRRDDLVISNVITLLLHDQGIGAADGTNPTWRDRALCAQTDPEAFYPEKGGSTKEAKQVCRSCDVRAECLEYALEHDERFGVWGGLSERERRRLKRQAI